jgi:hypothetical protein
VSVGVLDSPADVWPTVFQGFRREARLTPGYARSAFQAQEERPRRADSRSPRDYADAPVFTQMPPRSRGGSFTITLRSPASRVAGIAYDVSTTRVWYIRGCMASAGPGGRLTGCASSGLG